MFGRKKHKGAAKHDRNASTATTATTRSTAPAAVASNTPVSPLQGKFDLPPSFRDLPSPTSSVVSSLKPRKSVENFSRPRTSDGVSTPQHSRTKSGVSLQPPVLPPIPRVSSRKDGGGSSTSSNSVSREPSWLAESFEERPAALAIGTATGKDKAAAKARDDTDNVSTVSKKSSRVSLKSLRHKLSFEPVKDLPPFSFDRPFDRPATAGASTTSLPKMEEEPQMSATMFSSAQPPLSPAMSETFAPGPAMSRAFIDSRDKAFPTMGKQSTPVQSLQSSPNLLSSPQSPPFPAEPSSAKNPLSASNSTFGMGSRTTPQGSVTGLNALQKTPTNYSGSTVQVSAQASQSSSTTKGSRNRTESTIGTPYADTASTFPLPTHVATRPKTAGGHSTVAGVSVPTHHTSSKPQQMSQTDKSKEPMKKERRKTMLLNPMNLLTRRRSEDPKPVLSTEEQRAQDLALRKQKKVAAVGVDKTPDNFDPSIRGKVVHDFSAPRPARRDTTYSMFSYEEAAGGRPSTLQNTQSTPLMSSGAAASNEIRQSTLSDDSPRRMDRRSDHAPIFLEHLTESSPTGLLAAETRENKDFLQRASGISNLSQESNVLPPFARRSQVLDATQAGLWSDRDSKRSSDPSTTGRERDSDFSGMSSVSPVTGRTSVANTDLLLRDSLASPVSPQSDRFKSPMKSPSLASSAGRPVSDVSSVKSPRPGSVGVALQPSVEPIAEDSPVCGPPPRSPPPPPGHFRSASEQAPEANLNIFQSHSRYNSAEAPEVILSPPLPPIVTPFMAGSRSASGIPSPSMSNFSGRSNESTPEPMTVDSAIQMRQPGDKPQLVDNRASMVSSPKLVEKRASAVGHSRRTSLGPNHAKSNASRFSFQLSGENSINEEKILEEKHRRMTMQASPNEGYGEEEEEEEEEEDFDPDAMDDLDEMELRTDEAHPMAGGLSGPAGLLGNPSQMQTGHTAPPAKDKVVEDDGGYYDYEHIPDVQDERELGYFDHPAFRAHSALANHFRGGSVATLATLPGGAAPTLGSMRSGYSGWKGDTVDSCLDSYGLHSSPSNAWTIKEESRSGAGGSPLAKQASSALSREATKEEQPEESSPSKSASHEEQKNNFYLQPNAGGGSGWSSMWSNGKPSRGTSSASGISGSSNEERTSEYSTKKDLKASQSAKSRQSVASHMTAATTATAKTMPDGGPYNSRAMRKVKLQEKRRQTAALENMPVGSGLGIGGWGTFDFSDGPDLRLASDETPPLPIKSVDRDFSRRTMDSATLPREPSVSEQVASIRENDSPSPPQVSPEQEAKEHFPVSSPPNKRVTTSTLSPTISNKGNWDELKPQNRTPVISPSLDQPSKQHASYFGSPSNDTRMQSAAYAGKIGQGLHVRDEGKMNQNHQYANPDDLDNDRDDMYFDDGGFANEDLDADTTRSGSVDENALDSPGFWTRMKQMNGGGGGGVEANYGMPPVSSNHQRDMSGITVASLGSDGPYPSFAIPNPAKARQRDSHMLLEDLVLQGPVDPRLIPQRNPSEDAKRLGLSSKVPPLPAGPGGEAQANSRMQAYHAALADALNKADAAGRFLRVPSVKTERSISLYPMDEGEDKSVYSRGDTQSQYSRQMDDGEDKSVYSRGDAQSHYSRDEDGEQHLDVAQGPQRSTSHTTEDSMFDSSLNYSPPKLGFDFGFDASHTPGHEHISDVPIDDYGAEDDLIAAANAEALAIDDGTYGQDFGFFANARPNSRDAEQINGGFFGQDGDDGLTRQKSLKEPNLTPITERSEFSTRNSYIGLHTQTGSAFGPASAGMFGPPSAGGYGPTSSALARLPVSPLADHETNLDQLRRLRISAFNGSNGSLGSDAPTGKGPGSFAWHANRAGQSPSAASANSGHGYFPAHYSGSPINYSSSDKSSPRKANFGDNSPASASSGQQHRPVSGENEVTPRKAPPASSSQEQAGDASPTVRKPALPFANSNNAISHSRKGSDSVTYVQEPDPTGTGPPRWVLERRRTSEQGALELVGREVVQGGWI